MCDHVYGESESGVYVRCEGEGGMMYRLTFHLWPAVPC